MDEFVKAEAVAERAGARHVVVLFILNAEGDPGHLLHRALDCFEMSRQDEIAKRFPFKNEHGKMLVRRVAGQLRQHRMPGRHRRFPARRRRRRAVVLLDDFPFAGFPFAGHGAVEAGGRLVQSGSAEIKMALRRAKRPGK